MSVEHSKINTPKVDLVPSEAVQERVILKEKDELAIQKQIERAFLDTAVPAPAELKLKTVRISDKEKLVIDSFPNRLCIQDTYYNLQLGADAQPLTLGSGMFGSLYLAEPWIGMTDDGKAMRGASVDTVALKCIPVSPGTSDYFMKLFSRELVALNRARQLRSAQLFITPEGQQLAVIAMELAPALDGTTLLQEREVMSLEKRSSTADQLFLMELFDTFVDQLLALAKRGYMMLDIKLENVLIRRSKVRESKLVDFGTARSIQELFQNGSTIETLNEQKRFIATPNFLSPNGMYGDYDNRDVYALGVLFGLFTGIAEINVSKKKNDVFEKHKSGKHIMGVPAVEEVFSYPPASEFIQLLKDIMQPGHKGLEGDYEYRFFNEKERIAFENAQQKPHTAGAPYPPQIVLEAISNQLQRLIEEMRLYHRAEYVALHLECNEMKFDSFFNSYNPYDKQVNTLRAALKANSVEAVDQAMHEIKLKTKGQYGQAPSQRIDQYTKNKKEKDTLIESLAEESLNSIVDCLAYIENNFLDRPDLLRVAKEYADQLRQEIFHVRDTLRSGDIRAAQIMQEYISYFAIADFVPSFERAYQSGDPLELIPMNREDIQRYTLQRVQENHF